MPRRFPLYAKILLWFFLNLTLLAAAFYGLVRAQLRLGPDSLLTGSAHDRIEALSDIILSELRERPQAEWDDLLKRFGRGYRNQVQFFVFRADASRLAGEPVELPREVRERVVGPPGRRGPPPGTGLLGPGGLPPEERRGEPRLPRRPGEEKPLQEPPAPAFPPPAEESANNFPPAPLEPPFLQPRGPRPKQVLHTRKPSRYWVLVRAGLPETGHPRPLPITLVFMSGSLSGGGLFFDVKPWLAVALGAVVFSGLLWLPLVRGITHSIGQMTQATRRIAEGRFDVRVDERRRDELGELGRSVNQMAARLEGLVAGQKRFLGDIAHELCSPLAKLRMALGILEQRARDDPQPYLGTASDKAAQMADLVNELLSFSRASASAAAVTLQAVSAREAVEKALAREASDGATCRMDVPPDLRVAADPELLVRALSNLVRNAVRYAGQAGPIEVSASREGRQAVLTVTDCGPGVPEQDLERVFDPFYRVDLSRDRATGGVGLGLAIVKTCIEACRGSVACRNRQPAGLEVTLRLAISDEAP